MSAHETSRLSSSPPSGGNDFTAHSQQKRTGIAADFVGFMAENRKWWLLPIVMVTLLAGLLVLLGGTGAAPFIYTLF